MFSLGTWVSPALRDTPLRRGSLKPEAAICSMPGHGLCGADLEAPGGCRAGPASFPPRSLGPSPPCLFEPGKFPEIQAKTGSTVISL